MSGNAESSFESMSPEQQKAHLGGLEQFHTGLEKLHMAEAELARVRADLARSGVDLTAPDSLHW